MIIKTSSNKAELIIPAPKQDMTEAEQIEFMEFIAATLGPLTNTEIKVRK